MTMTKRAEERNVQFRSATLQTPRHPKCVYPSRAGAPSSFVCACMPNHCFTSALSYIDITNLSFVIQRKVRYDRYWYEHDLD